MDVSPPLPLAPPALVRGPSPLRFMVLLCVVSAFHALDDTASPSPVPLKARIPNRAKKKRLFQLCDSSECLGGGAGLPTSPSVIL